MNRPVTHDADLVELGHLIDANLNALFRDMAWAIDGAELHEGARADLHHASPSNPMFKGVWNLRGDVSAMAAAAGYGIARLAALGAPFAFVWPGSFAPPELSEALAAIDCPEFDRGPGMAADLADLDWSLLERLPDGTVIAKAEDVDAVEDFATVFAAGFGVPRLFADAWVDAAARCTSVATCPWSYHVAWIHGRPVAATIAYEGAGVATVFGVATAPEFRGRGLGAAITLAGYAGSRERGYRYAVLFATESGLPVYRRMGFRETGTEMVRHLWAPGMTS